MSLLKAQIDQLLTNVSSKYIPEGFISEQFMPMIQSAQYSGLLGKYGNNHLRIFNSLKGGESKYKRVETRQATTSRFQIEGHGLEGVVSKEDYKNYSKPFDAEKDETEGLTTSLYIEKEKMLADTVTDTAIITQNTTLAGTSQFSDYANSNPLDIFKTARKTIRDACGKTPDTAAFDWGVFDVLRYHPQILDALGFKYDRPGGLGIEELAKALGLRRLLIADVVYNSAKEGQADALAPVWGKHIVFAVAPEKAAQYQVSFGYRIQLEGSQPRKVYKEAQFNPPGSTAILVEDEYDMFTSNVNAAYLIKNAIA